MSDKTVIMACVRAEEVETKTTEGWELVRVIDSTSLASAYETIGGVRTQEAGYDTASGRNYSPGDIIPVEGKKQHVVSQPWFLMRRPEVVDLLAEAKKLTTEAEHRNLLNTAGLRLIRVIPTPSQYSILEAVSA